MNINMELFGAVNIINCLLIVVVTFFAMRGKVPNSTLWEKALIGFFLNMLIFFLGWLYLVFSVVKSPSSQQ